MRWGRGIALLAVLLLIPAVSGAQYLTYDAARRGNVISESVPSLRLAAMGGLRLTIPDENNEINLSDFGGNLAGIVSDRTGWSVESWYGRDNGFTDKNVTHYGSPVRQRDRLDLDTGGLDVVYRRRGTQAVGMTVLWDGYDARLTYGPNTRVTGPNARYFVNQVFGSLSTAIGVTWASDKEDLVSSDVFSIYHASKTRRLSMAAAWDLGMFTAAAQVDADRVRIDGLSADPAGFHRDKYDWRRPATNLRLTLVRPEGPGALAFGVNLGRLHREGTEEMSVSWSDRFPENPSRVNYSIRIPSFVEKEDSWDAEGRMSYRLSPRLRLGGYGRYQKLDSKVDVSPNSNFASSRQQEDAKLKTWQIGGGAGLTLPGGRLRAGLEGEASGGKLDSRRIRETVVEKTRTYAMRLGTEYFFAGDLAARAGYVRQSHDYAVGEPASLGIGNGLTLGMGFLPRGGLFAIDGFLRVWKETPDVAGSTDHKVESQDLGVSARLLF